MIGFVSRLFSILKPVSQSSDDGTQPMWLLVGLGNPGAKYKDNRHNVGFMAIDAIADRFSIGPFKAKYQGQLAEGRIGDQKVALLKPETFMNESGRSVGAAAKFYKIDPDHIIAFHDELDLDPGKNPREKPGAGMPGIMACGRWMHIWERPIISACVLALAIRVIRTASTAMCWAIFQRPNTFGWTRTWKKLADKPSF